MIGTANHALVSYRLHLHLSATLVPLSLLARSISRLLVTQHAFELSVYLTYTLCYTVYNSTLFGTTYASLGASNTCPSEAHLQCSMKIIITLRAMDSPLVRYLVCYVTE